MLQEVCDSHGNLNLSTYNQLLYEAVFSLVYHAFLMIGEYVKLGDTRHTLSVQNLKLNQNLETDLVISALKSFNDTCLFFLMLPSWCSIKNTSRSDLQVSGPLFITKNVATISNTQVTNVQRLALDRLRLDPSEHGTHTLWIGEAIDTADQGNFDHVIMKTGD